MTKMINTTCPYCGVGCGITATVDDRECRVKIAGDIAHPANFGRLCSKGSALGETLGLSARLLWPRVLGKASSWDNALNTVANGFLDTIKQYGVDAVAIYGSGQLLTEDYYVANKLMKGFIGSGNMDTNSRLCMSSSVAGHKRAFGADTVPGCYEDLELADLIVLIGSNTAWCHPVSFQRIRAAKVARPHLKIVVIDPRRTATCDIADLHLPLVAGSDTTLFNGLLHYLGTGSFLNYSFIHTHTEGFDPALSAASFAGEAHQVAAYCGLDADDVQRFFDWFASTEKVISIYSQGVNQSSSGTDKVNAIINCHLATGRIGKPGMGPFSLTGQPNAMGGREVGGLAHQLAAHMDFAKPDDIDRVARFWRTDNIAQTGGLPAVELFDALYEGKIKAVWIMGTNPVVSLPDADKVKRALQQCPLVVVSDCVDGTDTGNFAHIVLPAQGWSEKDGTVTNSERCISRQRALLPAAGEAKPDWWIISQVAQRMGFVDAFAYQNPAQIFREHAALSGFENDGQRDFDISALAQISDAEYEQLLPLQWPVNAKYLAGRARFFDDGHYFTASGKAQFISIVPRPPAGVPDADYPLVLNTGRLRDQWHTMTRTALAAKLNQHSPEPVVEVHPIDARCYGLTDNGLATLASRWGGMTARVRITDDQKQGNVFVPMHWTACYASRGRMGALVNPKVDPISKQPESKHTPVRIAAYHPAWQGFVLTRQQVAFDDTDYWVKINGEGYYRYELAGEQIADDWRQWAKTLLDYGVQAQWIEYQDLGLGNYRCAQVQDNRLMGVIFVASHNRLPDRNWLGTLFNEAALSLDQRRALLAGQPPLGITDTGRIVCACFNVGKKTICTAIKEKGLTTSKEIGQYLKAGSNCGSCVPELNRLLKKL